MALPDYTLDAYSPAGMVTGCDCAEGYGNVSKGGCNCQPVSPKTPVIIDANPNGTGLVPIQTTAPITTNPLSALTSNPTIMYLGLGLVAYLLLKK